MLSNGVTNIDSVTSFQQYIDRAKELGMNAIAFTEHGSVFEWYHKKCAVEAAGMKYIHAVEAYLTESLDEKVRDNYHCCLYARNYEGVKELNRMISASFNRSDNHFYYTPRISFDELEATSSNIIITTACIGGALYKGTESAKQRFLDFCIANKDRCFLEVQPHLVSEQVDYNKWLLGIHKQYGIPLIAGTDTHALDDTHIKGRSILQKSKDVHFDGEDGWELRFLSFDSLCDLFNKQRSIPEADYIEAIKNTNLLADLVEPFELDTHTKYPHIYENPEETFTRMVYDCADKHPYIHERYSEEKIRETIDSEIEVYKKTGSIDFMLLQKYLRDWEHDNGIYCGYGRGSVSGSFVAYVLGITEMDSLKFNLNFFRFMNPDRVSNADIDSDYGGEDRDKVKYFLLHDRLNLPQIQSSEIITFNTIAMKGAIRDVCRGLYRDAEDSKRYMEIASYICDNIDCDEDRMRKEYPEVFEYVDIVNGVIVSIGSHPSGVLVTDRNIAEDIGFCTTSGSEYPVSMLNMKELDALMYVKLDILGLDNMAVINQTCKLAGIERATPDNIPLDDMKVWESIRDDTTMIFQFESNSAQAYLRKLFSEATIAAAKKRNPHFSMIKWLSFGNGLIRPSCASFRDDVANGNAVTNGMRELDEFLSNTMGHIAMQEDIMQFLVKFCGYSAADSDSVRRLIAKKVGTEAVLPEIKRRFIEYSMNTFHYDQELCEKVINPFIQVILDASSYGFSWNHSDAYSCIGYICGYLRYYYPLEFVAAALNVFSDNEEKTAAIVNYAAKNHVSISPAKFGKSRAGYMIDHDAKTIYKGMESIKYMNSAASEFLYSLKDNRYDTFMDLLLEMYNNPSVNTRQIDVLIKIGFFSDFGNIRELSEMKQVLEFLKNGNAKSISRSKVDETWMQELIQPYVEATGKNGKELKSYRVIDMSGILKSVASKILSSGLKDVSFKIKIQNQRDYLGYVDLTTNREEDRRKLFVMDVRPMAQKIDGKRGAIWGYAVFTRSVGSGKQSRLTVRASDYDATPIRQGDVIFADRVWKNNRGYWYLDRYHQVDS